MNSINSISIPSQSLVNQTAKTLSPKHNRQQTDEQSAFSKYLHSISPDGQNVSENRQKEETLKKLEETLKSLEELPSETLSPKELEVLSAMLQMLSQQITNMKDMQQGNNQQMTLSKVIEQEIKELSAASTINYVSGIGFVGGEEKNFFPANQNDAEGAFNQFSELIQQFEINQQTMGEHKATSHQEEQEQMIKLFQQLDSLIGVFESNKAVVEQEQNYVQPLINESTFESEGSPFQTNQEMIMPGVEEAGPTEESIDLRLEPVQTQNNSQTITGSGVQDIKGSQSTTQIETSPETPVVRMTNMIEDLSEILRGTFRLRANQEGTQLKINIFPEHLGHLDIRLTTSEGKITAQIFTASLTAKEALDQQVNQLRNSLMQQGLTVEKIEISYQNSQQSFGQQHANPEHYFAQQQRQGNTARNGQAFYVNEEEPIVGRNHLLDGSVKVNYTI